MIQNKSLSFSSTQTEWRPFVFLPISMAYSLLCPTAAVTSVPVFLLSFPVRCKVYISLLGKSPEVERAVSVCWPLGHLPYWHLQNKQGSSYLLVLWEQDLQIGFWGHKLRLFNGPNFNTLFWTDMAFSHFWSGFGAETQLWCHVRHRIPWDIPVGPADTARDWQQSPAFRIGIGEP